MKKLRSVLSIVLAVALFMVFGNVSAFAAKDSEKSVLRHLETPVLGENKEMIGTKITDATIKTQVTKDGTTTIITEKKTYRFSSNNVKYQELFRDKETSTKIYIDAKGNYYVNDSKLSSDVLNTQLIPNATSSVFSAASIEDGGCDWLTYYTNLGIPPLDYFKTYSYEDANFFLDYSSGHKVTKWLSTSPDLSDFKLYANNVASARSDINIASVGLIAAGVGVLTPAVILGLIATSAAAFSLWVASNDGHDAMEDAYNLLVRLGGSIE